MTNAQLAFLLAAIPCGLGVIFILIAYLRRRMLRGWVGVTGVVVQRRTGGMLSGLPERNPTFQWQDRQGNRHRHTSIIGGSLGPSPGKRVPILYDPDNPSRGVIDSHVQTLRIFFPIGSALIVLGVLTGVMTLGFGSATGMSLSP